MICCLSLTSVNLLSKIWTKWWISRACCLQFEQLNKQLWHTSSREETGEHLTVYAIVWWLSLLLRSNWTPSPGMNYQMLRGGLISHGAVFSAVLWLLYRLFFASHAVCFCSVSTFLHWISCIFFLASFQMLRCKERRFVKNLGSFSNTGVISPWSDLMCIWLIQVRSRRGNHLSWFLSVSQCSLLWSVLDVHVIKPRGQSTAAQERQKRRKRCVNIQRLLNILLLPFHLFDVKVSHGERCSPYTQNSNIDTQHTD